MLRSPPLPFVHPPVPAILSECLTSKPCPLYMLSNSLCSLLGASRSPRTHSVQLQALSDVLHSYPAAFTSSPFPSLCSLGTPLLSSLHKQIPSIPCLVCSSVLHFPLYAPRSPLFPSSHTQISSVPFSVCLVLTCPLCAHSHPSFPCQVPSDSHCCPPSTLRSHPSLLWVLSSYGSCRQIPSSPSVYPPFPSIFPPCTLGSPPFPLYAHRVRLSDFPSVHTQTPPFLSVHAQIPTAALHLPSFAPFLERRLLSSVATHPA